MPSKLEYTRASLKLTGKCNSGCSHCYNDSRPDSQEFMPKEVAFRALDLVTQNMVDSPVFDIHYTGGDPLEHPDFEEIVEYGTSLSKDIKILVSTTDLHYRKDPKKFKETLGFLRNNRLHFIGFNSDTAYRNGSRKTLEELSDFCVENKVWPMLRTTFDDEYKPYYMGRAMKNLRVEECDTKPKTTCDEAEICVSHDLKNNVHNFIHINFNEKGNVQYCDFCDFNIDGNPTVKDSNETIINNILNDPIRASVTKRSGLTRFFKKVSSLTNKYDYIPANCARFRAIQHDKELLEDIRKQLWTGRDLNP